MKICYIIKTCNQYLDNRVLYQANSFIKNINKNDIYYLTSKSNISKRHFGWDVPDSYEYLTFKILYFIYNIEIFHYDWYIFIDDDTFVFTKRLEKLLHNYDSNLNYYIGKQLDHIKNDFCLYMSGGAGYVLSKSLFILLKNYIKLNGIEKSFKHWCEDLTVGLLINELSNHNKIIQINNNDFHTDRHTNKLELNTSITFHRVTTEEQYIFYTKIINQQKEDTVFALVTDESYFQKAKRTIIDLRSKGNWRGPIALITVGFDLNANFTDFYDILEVKFDTIDKTQMLQLIGENGFSDGDKRELNKLNQWEKLHIFDEYFTQWQRVVYLDAGLRVLDDVKYLLEVEYKGAIIAPRDGKINAPITFGTQISYDNPELVKKLTAEYGSEILQSNHMLNCVWIYDTDILKICNKTHLIEAMNKWPLCKTNEMTIMNLLLHFKYKLWKYLTIYASNGKILFDWCELNNLDKPNWNNYCLLKYPVSLSFNDC